MENTVIDEELLNILSTAIFVIEESSHATGNIDTSTMSPLTTRIGRNEII